jgi:hypothetical protein
VYCIAVDGLAIEGKAHKMVLAQLLCWASLYGERQVVLLCNATLARGDNVVFRSPLASNCRRSTISISFLQPDPSQVDLYLLHNHSFFVLSV